LADWRIGGLVNPVIEQIETPFYANAIGTVRSHTLMTRNS
jgi:hypothetical protein